MGRVTSTMTNPGTQKLKCGRNDKRKCGYNEYGISCFFRDKKKF
jgi:hypothetical protein